MLVASWLLLVIAVLGAFDCFYFHRHRCGLARRLESRREAWIHVVRGAVYATQLVVVPCVRLTGAWYAALVALFVVDVTVAVADVLAEPASRAGLGGLARGEYLMHVVLSVLVGAMLRSIAGATAGWPGLPTAIAWAPVVPPALAWALGALAAGCALNTVLEVLELLDRPGRPLHVAVRLRCSLAALWTLTQDHLRHPSWDHRFSRIIMLDDVIRTGTLMRYEKRLLGITIRGHGRYKLHRPLRQSTFEFWSDERRSLIRRGVGLWRYEPQADGTVVFRTTYTYSVRWGLLGRWLDRLAFRPLLLAETARSFRRLAARHFPDGAGPVVASLR